MWTPSCFCNASTSLSVFGDATFHHSSNFGSVKTISKSYLLCTELSILLTPIRAVISMTFDGADGNRKKSLPCVVCISNSIASYHHVDWFKLVPYTVAVLSPALMAPVVYRHLITKISIKTYLVRYSELHELNCWIFCC
jgi:hypothetical protein